MAAAATPGEGSAASARSGGGTTAESYIGSLISLTSKSEIRYEGILYNINTEESSIGLRNVRSFGTEGRKKDGPQVPPSDKIYEYILFRGSDIKDLQVKSSPSVQTTPPINSDPAIIQSHYTRPTTSSSSFPTSVGGSLPDLPSQSTPLGQPGSNFQSALPLYQPGGSMGSWGPSPPPPNANGSGLPMPMYWQGFYGAPGGMPQLHQQSLVRPPTGLSMPPSMQHMQYPGFNPSLLSGPSNLPEYPSPLVPSSSGSLASSSSAAPLMPSALPPFHQVPLPSGTVPSMISNKATISGVPSTTLGATPFSILPLTTSGTDMTTVNTSSKPNSVSSMPSLHQTPSQPVTSVSGSPSSTLVEAPTPLLVTPGQLLQSTPSVISSVQSSQIAQKDVEVVKVSPKASPDTPSQSRPEAQPPLLPLPSPARSQKPNGSHYQMRQNYRGRGGRGAAGMSRPVTKFTEEFDFMAMNEKFKKEEVWGDLGRSNKSKDINGYDEEDEAHEEDEIESPNVDTKSGYNKDDFFDNLSCNAVDNDPNHGRVKFSEQMKLDTETFGDFSRYRGGRGGRGGRSRGSYYGRGGYGYGYGYVNRGRGRGRGGVSDRGGVSNRGVVSDGGGVSNRYN